MGELPLVLHLSSYRALDEGGPEDCELGAFGFELHLGTSHWRQSWTLGRDPVRGRQDALSLQVLSKTGRLGEGWGQASPSAYMSSDAWELLIGSE